MAEQQQIVLSGGDRLKTVLLGSPLYSVDLGRPLSLTDQYLLQRLSRLAALKIQTLVLQSRSNCVTAVRSARESTQMKGLIALLPLTSSLRDVFCATLAFHPRSNTSAV